MGTDLFARRYSIGIWFWETNVFRDGSADVFVDEVWATSDYVRDAVEPQVAVPVHVVPMPVEAPAQPVVSRDELGLPAGFIFLVLFDFGAGSGRTRAASSTPFATAFAPDEGPVLVLKSINGRELEATTSSRSCGRHVADRPRTSSSGRVRGREASATPTLASCDCYVSLHRSEGLGLTLAEAMARTASR